MNIQIVKEDRRIYLTGNTYPVRDEIRALGGHWDADRKAWWMTSAKIAEAEKIAAAAPAPAPKPAQADGPMVDVAGNTYPVRDQIRALGGRWDAARKVWRVPASAATKARELVAGAPKSSKPFRRKGTWTGCSCGSVEEYARDSDCATCSHDRW